MIVDLGGSVPMTSSPSQPSSNFNLDIFLLNVMYSHFVIPPKVCQKKLSYISGESTIIPKRHFGGKIPLLKHHLG